MEQFNFDAPQFCDFLNLDDSADDVESYFDTIELDGLPKHVIYIEDFEPESASESSVTNSLSSQIDNLTINGDSDHTMNSFRKTKRAPLKTDKTRARRRSRSLQSPKPRFTNYVTMAEAVHKFHFKTPKRYHSRLSRSETSLNKMSKCMGQPLLCRLV
ncbi:hypothetical protein FQR65_LT06912 [Abscondita terminalis]|nr:hypothetical protein FQR65_LT06912 [Abscondita terminalis]